MHELPHHYRVGAKADADGTVEVSSPGLESLDTAAPAEYGGPGDRWSPETLFVASVANCFILTFRAIARASKFDWSRLECKVEGELDRVDRITQFTAFNVSATLEVAAGVDHAKAIRLMEKAERGCLITNSLKAPTHLRADVVDA